MVRWVGDDVPGQNGQTSGVVSSTRSGGGSTFASTGTDRTKKGSAISNTSTID